MTWECNDGTPDEDHDWAYDGGDWTVGVPGHYYCKACGKVDDTDREPPSYEEFY